MKKVLLTAFLLGGSLFAYAQQYYWSSGVKHALTTDSTTVIIKSKSAADLSSAVNRMKLSAADKDAAYRQVNATNVTVKFNAKRDLAAVAKTLGNSEIIYAHKNGKAPFVLTGTVLYQLADGKSIADVENFIAKENLGSVQQTQGAYQTVVLTPSSLKQVLPIANKLYESGLVKWSHPDFYSDFKVETNDPNYNNQYYLDNYAQTGGTANIDIDYTLAISNFSFPNAVRVAVIDDGVEAHEDLGNRVVAGYSAGGFGTGAPASASAGHGEACAGIIGATRDNNLGVAGIASNAIIVPVNIFNGINNTAASAFDIATSINWAWDPAQGNAAVLSCSWGGGAPSDAITTAINNARTQGRGGLGCIVVFSAGNFANGSASNVSYPANVNGVISVGAIDKYGNRWGYSPNNPMIVAPTGNTNNLGDVYTLDRMGTNGYYSGNYTSTFGGTSAACPQVSGVAALILSASPWLTEAQVKSAILSGATNMGNTTSFGVGRLNAYNAVKLSQPTITGPDQFCTTTALYTVNNAPPGATFAWSQTNSGASITPTGNPAVVSVSTKGYGQVSVSINGGQYTLSKYVTMGTTAIVSASQQYCAGSYTQWYLQATPVGSSAVSNISWQPDPSSSGTYNFYSPNSLNTYATVANGGGYVNVKFTDACGYPSLYSGTLIYTICPSGMRMANITAYPNPANTQLNIEDLGTTDPASTAKTTSAKQVDFEAKLYDGKGFLLRTASTKGDKRVSFNVSSLPDGTYYLHIFQNGERSERQVIVRH
ncbi:putative secreted protein (Por secretion system target) [Chitinophaga skermanii]|uniref:Putative secreted protein (Por secretion system target) n=1 Tax=Chitinophaga skermanii TaxID=331697 RepID=A0A327QVL6_9BACT|nr:S8 family serine peptidase [Chitinophaga skermanii]RAJ08706.1 putative secreted protein (Por secretion system target) [Chitinophaga skermanii]